MEENTTNQGQTPGTPSPATAEAKPSENRVLMGVLAYLGILVVVPYLLAKSDPFVRFHIKQGLVLVVIELGVWVLSMTSMIFFGLIGLINLGAVVLSIIGIVNVINNREKELPIVGGFSKYFDTI